MEYKTGTKFHVCSHKDFLEKGWDYDGRAFWHDDFPNNNVNEDMIELEGTILTISKYGNEINENWYAVEENNWTWPVATFLKSMVVTVLDRHWCREGMTPIDGWIICKTCGTNMSMLK